MRRLAVGNLILASAALVFAAVEGSAGGVRWVLPARWQASGPRPMRMATYTIPAAPGSEAGECGVFYFGQGRGGSVEENLDRWVKQFESAGPPKRSEQNIRGLKVHRIDVSGSYLTPGGPMMQSQGKKPGWRLIGAIVEAPEGLVFFKAVGPAATMQKAEKDFEELVASLSRAGAKA
jgi:hypothetical protein